MIMVCSVETHDLLKRDVVHDPFWSDIEGHDWALLLPPYQNMLERKVTV